MAWQASWNGTVRSTARAVRTPFSQVPALNRHETRMRPRPSCHAGTGCRRSPRSPAPRPAPAAPPPAGLPPGPVPRDPAGRGRRRNAPGHGSRPATIPSRPACRTHSASRSGPRTHRPGRRRCGRTEGVQRPEDGQQAGQRDRKRQHRVREYRRQPLFRSYAAAQARRHQAPPRLAATGRAAAIMDSVPGTPGPQTGPPSPGGSSPTSGAAGPASASPSCACATRDQPTTGPSGSSGLAAASTPSPSCPPPSGPRPAPQNKGSMTPLSSTPDPAPGTDAGQPLYQGSPPPGNATPAAGSEAAPRSQESPGVSIRGSAARLQGKTSHRPER